MTRKILYIAGIGRNGGTLVDRVLGSMEGWCSLGEFRFVWKKGAKDNELCNCGVPFRDCPFWNAVFEAAFGGFGSVDAEAMTELDGRVARTRMLPMLLSPYRPERLDRGRRELVRMLARLFNAIADVSGCEVLVDSSKFAGYGALLAELPGFECHVLHLVRDSRAAAYSWSKLKRKLEVVDEEAYLRRYSTASSAVQWCYRNVGAEALRWRAKRYLRLRYEDLAAEPAAYFNQVLRFVTGEIGRVPVEGRSAFVRPSHMQGGNPMRFVNGEVQIRVDDEWMSQMARRDERVVSAVTWPLLWRYGYRSVGSGRVGLVRP